MENSVVTVVPSAGPLAAEERSALQAHEAAIEREVRSFLEVGRALVAIRDGRLYRETHATFEAYCRERWGMSRTYAHRYIDAAHVCEMLPTGNTLANEAQVRPLTKIRTEDGGLDDKAILRIWRRVSARSFWIDRTFRKGEPMVAPLTVNNGYAILYHGRRYERFYDDGAWCRAWPADEAEVLQAERAFRDAFVETAHRSLAWRSVDTKAIAAAWRARERAMRQAEVRFPSADYFGVTDPEKRRRLRARQVAYQPGHRVEASRLRGIHHAMVYVEQGWEEARTERAAWGCFAAFVLLAWKSAVDQWAALPIRLGHCMPPPRPLEALTAEQRTLLAKAEPVQANVERQEPPLRLRRPAGDTGNLEVSSERNGACVPGEVREKDIDQERTTL